MKVVIIVQARMTSTRLPGKVLKTVLDKTLLEYIIERLQRVNSANEIVVATTINDTDQPIIDLCKKLSVECYRGSEDDVLSRYYFTAKEHKANVIVRVTSDCPVIDPQIIDNAIKIYLDNNGKYDYVSNSIERTYPRGMDVEVFSFKSLERAYNEATQKADREHVTTFLEANPRIFNSYNIKNKNDQSKHRWTVDTVEDFTLIKCIIEKLYPYNKEFNMEDILDLFLRESELYHINVHVKQKRYGE